MPGLIDSPTGLCNAPGLGLTWLTGGLGIQTGLAPATTLALLDRFEANVLDRANNNIFTRVQGGSGAIAGGFPGQAGNPVGFANTPAATPARWTAGTYPGAYPGSLTTGSTSFTSGTPASPTIVSFKDFQGGTTTLTVNVHDITFVGCRFAFNTPNNSSAANILNLGNSAYNVQFVYCTFMPLTSFGYTSPPGSTIWPSAGAQQNTITQVNNVNCVDGSSGYQFGIGAYSTNTSGSFMIQLDHCDFWGFGNGAVDTLGTTGQQNYYDCWIHDCCNASPIGFHQDGLGYLDGGTPPSNILINHCTIASIGNTNGIAYQAATSAYSNVVITNNYFSGYGYFCDPGHSTTGNSGWVLTDNTFGTDLQWIFGPIYGTPSAMFNNTGNIWRRNKLKVIPGTTVNSGTNPAWTLANDGQFILPTPAFSATDWAN